MNFQTWWRLLPGLFIFIFLSVVTPLSALAQDAEELFGALSPDEQVLVLELIDEGNEAYDQGDFQLALEHFEETYRLFPHPDVLYRLALCHERLGNDSDAIQHYRLFLSAVPDARERGRVERTIELLSARMEQVKGELKVVTTPEGAMVSLISPEYDRLGPTPIVIGLEPGTYELEIEKEGFERIQESITVERGQALELEKELTALVVEPPPSPSSRSLTKPSISLGLVGVGVLAAIFSGEFKKLEGEEQAKYDEYRLTRPNTDRAVGEARESQALRQINYYRGMRIGMIVTSATALTGAALLMGWWVWEGEGGSSVALSIDPSTEGLAVGISGRF